MLKILILGTLALGLLALAANLMTMPRGVSRARVRSGGPLPGRPAGLLRAPLAAAASVAGVRAGRREAVPPEEPDKLRLADEEWRARLTPEQYRVLRHGDTERPFTGKYWDHHEAGAYACAACGQDLFASTAKFDSGTGWPSYRRPVAKGAVAEVKDISYGMVRTEVVCSRCESHLGHVFADGPRPGGRRYCINSAALDFRPTAEA